MSLNTAQHKNLEDNKTMSWCSSTSTKASRPVIKREEVIWYRGIFGNVAVLKKARYSPALNSQIARKTPVIKEKLWRARPKLLSYALEMRYVQSFSHISRYLSIYPVLKRDAPIFLMCRAGNLEGVQDALSGGDMSPFVLDQSGGGLLHVSAPVKKS
jgi:hypothetical protein